MPLYKDLSGHEPGSGALARLGVVVTVAIVAIGYVISLWTGGAFTDKFEVTLVSNQIGDGVRPGTDVRFRGLRIGKVESAKVNSDGQQQVVLSIDPKQAKALTTDVVPVYAASSIFTSTDIEFVGSGTPGPQLRDNQTLEVHTDTALGTLTNVLSRAGKLNTTLGDPEVYKALEQLTNDADPYVKLLREALPIAADLTEAQTMPVAQLLNDAADIIGAIRPLVVPMFNVIDKSLDSTGWMDDPENLQNTSDAIGGLSKKIVVSIGNMLDVNQEDLTQLIRLILDIASPTVLSFASIPSTYDRLTTLLQGTDDAFSVGEDGRTRLNVELLLATAPQIVTPVISNEVGQP